MSTYLKDINKINHQHVEALKESSQAVMDIIDSDIDSNIEPLSENDAKASGEYNGGNWKESSFA